MRLITLLLLLLPMMAFGQADGTFKKPEPKKVVTKSAGPVTKEEVRKTMIRVWTVLAKGLKLSGEAPLKAEPLTGVATKEDILADFDKVLGAARVHFKRSPRPATLSASRIRKDGDANRMTNLVKLGMVAPYGPLVTGANDAGLSPEEFGVAVGSFMVRLADLAHMPSSKFTPSLMGG